MLLNFGVGKASWESLGLQSWIFIGRTDAEAETPIPWPPDAKIWLIRKGPNAGKIEGKRRRGRQRTRWLDSIINSMHMSLSKLQEMVKDRESRHAAVYRAAKSQTWLSTWTTICNKKFKSSPTPPITITHWTINISLTLYELLLVMQDSVTN